MSAFVRSGLLLAGALLFASCGSGTAGGGHICNEGDQSSPGMVGDPCPQTDTPCAAAGRAAYSVCTAEGIWGECVCQADNVCGNGVREGTEQCDGADLGGGTCALNNGTGTLMCSMCAYDFSMCTSSGNGGNGGN